MLTDPDMYLFVEEGLRGGISVITNSYSKANNPYLPNYNPKEDNKYIVYLDINNLYGWTMSKFLPTRGFDWLKERVKSTNSMFYKFQKTQRIGIFSR